MEQARKSSLLWLIYGRCMYREIWIYFEDYGNSLYKANISSPNIATILNKNASSSMNVTGDWIYYFDTSGYKLHKMKTDGTGIVKLNDTPCRYPKHCR